MNNKKSLDEILNEATQISCDREKQIKQRAKEIANNLFDESLIKKEDK